MEKSKKIEREREKKGKWGTMFHKVFHNVYNAAFDKLRQRPILGQCGNMILEMVNVVES